MSTIVTRSGKGSPLSHVEVDANFTNLNTDKIQSGNTVAALTITSATINGGAITGITDLAVADGGTGASDAATARTNLGLAIGTNVQAYDADLAAIAALAPTADNFIVGNGTAWTLETPAQARTSLGLGTAALVADSTLIHTSGNETIGGTKTFSVDASISGLTVGKGGGTVSTNTAVGYQAINATATGIYNVGVGYSALSANTSGEYNTAVGGNALQINTTGVNNSAFGLAAMAFNTSGGSNTALGMQALRSNTTASNSTAVGYQALYTNTDQSSHTAVGHQALYANTTGFQNTAVGKEALKANTTGYYNNAVGAFALGGNTTGNTNNAMGRLALYANTTGSNNTAIGQEALQANTTASFNTAVGYQAGYTGTASDHNAYLGYRAGYVNTGGYNCYLGDNAGVASSTGRGNTFVGTSWTNGCGYLMTTGSYNTILGGFTGNQGGLDIRTASNYIVLSDGDGNPRGYSDGSGNWTFTGSLKPSQTAGIIGTTTNNDANAGSVGEYIDSFVVTASVGTTPTTLTSISLTAGDWDVSGCVELNGANGVTSLTAAINTTTNSTSGTSFGKNHIVAPSSTFAGGVGAATLPRFRVIISSTTTYYLIGALGTTATNCNGYISARRMR